MTTLLATALLLACSPAVPQEIAPDAPARLRAHMEALGRLGFSGVVRVTRGEEVVFEGAWGRADRAAGVPASLDTVWPLGSITKTFTAAAVLRLVDAGELGLDDRLDRWFDGTPEDKAGITVRQLLNHTSGLPETGPGAQGGSREDYVQRALGLELAFAPGRAFGYSNTGYGLLAVLVELASGRSYREWLEQEVLDVAGMRASGFERDWAPARHAHGYIDAEDTGTLVGEARSWFLKGSGGMLATAADMGRWGRALGSGEVISFESLEAMTTPSAGRYGFGCGLGDSPLGKTVGHNGSNDVFSADWLWFPEAEVSVFAAANDADLYAFDVTPTLLEILYGHPVEAPPRAVAVAPDVLAALTGTWELEGGGGFVVRVAPEGGSLLLTSDDPRGAALLHPVGEAREGRRQGLLGSLHEAWESALEGELGPLRELVAPYSPEGDFAAEEEPRIGAWLDALGASRGVRTLPGRNRFGETAVVVVLAFEGGERRIEYSFGEREVGSIRFVDAPAVRRLHPLSPQRFLTWPPGAFPAVELQVRGAGEGARLALGGVPARRRP